jgi:hypothetical protein
VPHGARLRSPGSYRDKVRLDSKRGSLDSAARSGVGSRARKLITGRGQAPRRAAAGEHDSATMAGSASCRHRRGRSSPALMIHPEGRRPGAALQTSALRSRIAVRRPGIGDNHLLSCRRTQAGCPASWFGGSLTCAQVKRADESLCRCVGRRSRQAPMTEDVLEIWCARLPVSAGPAASARAGTRRRPSRCLRPW